VRRSLNSEHTGDGNKKKKDRIYTGEKISLYLDKNAFPNEQIKAKSQAHSFKADFQKFMLRIYLDICKYTYLLVINIIWGQWTPSHKYKGNHKNVIKDRG